MSDSSDKGKSGPHTANEKTGKQAHEQAGDENPAQAVLEAALEIQSDLLQGSGLTQALNDAIHGLDSFCVLAIDMDGIDIEGIGIEGSGMETGTDDEMGPVRELAAILRQKAEKENSPWGLLENGIFILLLPAIDKDKCLEAAEELRIEFQKRTARTISIGAAPYPEIDFQKEEIIDNASKALNHAEFLGHDSVVPFDSVSLNISGDRLYQEGDLDGAVREFKRALELDPGNVNVHVSLGVCWGDMEKYSDALEEFETAMKLDPEDVMAPYNAGLVHALKKDYDKSMEYFMAAEKVRPGTFEVLYHIGRILNEQKKYHEAREYLETAAEINPDSGSAHRGLGECLLALMEPEARADKEGDKESKENSNDYRKEEIEKAKKAFQTAVKINPNDAYSLSALGMIFDRIGENPDIARTFLEQSVSIAPENGLYRHRLAEFHKKRENLETALEQYKKARDAGHDSQAGIEEVQRLMTAQAS